MLVIVGALASAAPAGASLKQDLQRFSTCPYNTPGVVKCVYSTTNSGEFVIGKSAVPITKPVIIKGGLGKGAVLVPATDSNTLSKTALPVPGGLLGIELPGNFTEVTATAELAGQAAIATSVSLPLKVKLDNLALGGNCYIGSEAEPLFLHLVYGTTNPPPPNKPISGNVVITNQDGGNILTITGTLVDNAFAAPGARGCTLLPLVGDLAVNAKEGLPAPAGTNTAIMSGVTEEVSARTVAAVLPLPDIGRCVKVEGVAEGKSLVFHGSYTNSGCTLETEEHTGHYEWVPAPGPKPKFVGEGKALKLETSGKQSVTCAASSSQGEYTSAKTATITMTLTGCQIGPKSHAVACQSAGAAAGEIRTGSLAGGIEFINENEEPITPVVGIDLKPSAGGTVMTFDCGGSSASVTGSVIVPVTPLDKMTSALKLKALGGPGTQSPEAFEVGPKDTLTYTKSGDAAEAAGLTSSVSLLGEEPVEVKAIP